MKREAPKTILCTIDTRPEAIKMAPVIKAFQAAPYTFPTWQSRSASGRSRASRIARMTGRPPSA
jgi:hypothetical protein